MKKRIPIYHVEIKESTQIHWDRENRTLEFFNGDGLPVNKTSVRFGEAYERGGKAYKTIRLADCPQGQPSQALNYDRLMAIDTSYKSFGAYNICVGAALLLMERIPIGKVFNSGVRLSILELPRIVFLAKQGVNPERYAWMQYIKTIARYIDQQSDVDWASCGVIVDSELSRLPNINASEEGIFGNYYIPSNFSLIYASADVGKENLINKLIGATDKIARHSLEQAITNIDLRETVFEFNGVVRDVNILPGNIDFSI